MDSSEQHLVEQVTALISQVKELVEEATALVRQKRAMDSSQQPPQAEQAINYMYMEKDLYIAAEEGDWMPFDELQGDDLQRLVDGEKNTALHIHCRQLNWQDEASEFAKKLIYKCPSLLLQPNEKGEIPLHIAATADFAERFDIVKCIIECAKKLQDEDMEKGLNEMLRMTDNNGNTPLHKAAGNYSSKTMKLLLEELDPHFPFSANKSCETPLYIAAKKGLSSSVDAILEKCKSAACGGPNGTTALHAAVQDEDKDKVEALIKREKVLIKETDNEGRTPLHYAAHLGLDSIVTQLLKSDATVAYIRDKERGTTALHMAAWQGNISIMEDILSHCPGCVHCADNKGWTFLHFATVTLPLTKFSRLLHNKYIFEDLLWKTDINGNSPYDVMVSNPRTSYINIINFRRHQNAEKLKSNPYFNRKKEKEEQIQQILKEISKVKVAGKPVHKSFRENIRYNPPNLKDTVDKLRETHPLVATLVATVTFTAAITVPGGFKSDNGSAILSHNSAFKAFMITDAAAFTSSLLAILLHFLCVFIDSKKSQFSVLNWILVADGLTVFSMAAMVIAFSTGTYAVLESSLGIAISTCFIGLTFLSSVIVLLLFFLKALSSQILDSILTIIFKIAPPPLLRL